MSPTADIYDYILNGNLKGNVTLASDDVIAVDAYDCLVDITGKVKRPMVYEMKPDVGSAFSATDPLTCGWIGRAA